MTINILGSDYTIELRKFKEDEFMQSQDCDGYCDGYAKKIVLVDFDGDERFRFDEETARDNYLKQILRHEIIHAFLNESGLMDSAGIVKAAWSKNEEMIDWIAIQFPKIQKVFEKLNCL